MTLQKLEELNQPHISKTMLDGEVLSVETFLDGKSGVEYRLDRKRNRYQERQVGQDATSTFSNWQQLQGLT